MIRPSAARLWPPAVFAVAVFLLACAAITVSRRTELVAAVWPVDAVAAAFLVRWARTPAERAITVVLAAVSVAAANLLGGSSPIMAVAMAGLNSVNMLVAEAIVRRFGRPIDDLRAFAAFVLGAAVLAPGFTGASAAGLFWLLEDIAQPAGVALRWGFACGLGMMIFGVLAMTVRLPRRDESAASWTRFAAGQAVVLLAASSILFVPGRPPLFMLCPVLVVGALSHRELGGITAVALTAVVAWIATVFGRGPALIADLVNVDRAFLMQVLLASMVFTVLPVSALLRRLDMLARELERRHAAAETRSEVRTRLLAHVSHEIRSPLSGVTGLAELMREGALGALTAEQRDTLGQILSTGAEVDQLARDLTDALAIESGVAQVRISDVHVGDAVRSAVNLARFRISQHAAEVQLTSADAYALRVAADPLRLRQILVNLLVNAAKYGGRPPLIRISAIETGRATVRFEVADNGAGVPEDRRPDLFREFERLGAEQSDLEGAGLGLALSQQIAQVQNGVLGVEDSELGGALFWLELPLWRAEKAQHVAA